MPARRLLMRKIRGVLRLRHEQGLSHRAVARACGVGVGTVNRYLRRAAECGLGWPLPADLDDAVLEARLFPRAAPVRDRVRPDCAHIHREMKRGGVTLQLLWEGYAEVHPDGYRYTQFCGIYRQWARLRRPSMRQVHRAGEKTLHRLLREAAGPGRPADGGAAAGRAVRRRARGERLHLRRGDRDPAVACWVDAHVRMVEYSGARPPCGSPTSSEAPSPSGGYSPGSVTRPSSSSAP